MITSFFRFPRQLLSLCVPGMKPCRVKFADHTPMFLISLTPAKSSTRQGTGSIAEIAIVVIIVSVGILSTLMLLRSASRAMIMNREYVSGEALAIELVEKLKVVPYARLKATSDYVDASEIDSLLSLDSIPAELTEVKRRVKIIENEGVKLISVDVTWKTKGKEGENARGARRYHFLKTPYY